jgi:hypothetical protein
MDWVKIGSALFMGAMLIYLFPRAKHAVENSPKGSIKDWLAYIVPMVAIVLFIVVLMKLL